MKQRWFLSILSALALIYYALPRLPFGEVGLPQYFSILWLIFALLAIGGNLAAFLFADAHNKSLERKDKQNDKHYDKQLGT